jgi:hypothetical protein
MRLSAVILSQILLIRVLDNFFEKNRPEMEVRTIIFEKPRGGQVQSGQIGRVSVQVTSNQVGLPAELKHINKCLYFRLK